jgi:glycine/D-amino acid oxidase-like deaminating enzyme
MKSNYNILIIGGGFYGLYLAEYFSKKAFKVLLCEKDEKLMMRASYSNQARVHNGYHYPRSVLTAFRSRISFPRFSEEFSGCIESDFEKYYLIGSPLGKVSAKQFKSFCNRIGSPCERAPDRIRKLTNPKLIEDVFSTTEWAFDSLALKDIMLQRLALSGVEIMTNCKVNGVFSHGNKLVAKISQMNGKDSEVVFDQVFNCTYSSINQVNQKSSIAPIPLKHEMTEMCLVDVPDEIKDKAFTVMCGPFFSVMPFPSTPYHSFSHVRYTPHYEWRDDQTERLIDAHAHIDSVTKNTAWSKIKQDSKRYMPILGDCEYKSSIWEVKTVLPSSEIDDSRPILFKQDYGLKGYHCVMGGKIDNVYDVVELIKQRGLDQYV